MLEAVQEFTTSVLFAHHRFRGGRTIPSAREGTFISANTSLSKHARMPGVPWNPITTSFAYELRAEATFENLGVKVSAAKDRETVRKLRQRSEQWVSIRGALLPGLAATTCIGLIPLDSASFIISHGLLLPMTGSVGLRN